MTLERRAAMATLLADRPKNLFVVPGLGSTTWDAVARRGDDDRNFYLWGAMGGAAMIGLGLALAQPKLRVAVITGDGEMLMGLGSLATIGVQQPPNLFDRRVRQRPLWRDRHAGEPHPGRRRSCATLRGPAASSACSISHDEDGLTALARLLRTSNRMLFARVPISPDDPPRVLPEKDGVIIKERVRRAAERVARG